MGVSKNSKRNLPFQCEYCQRSFPTLISKKQHVRIHVHNKNKNKVVGTSSNNNNSSNKNKTNKNNSTPVPTSTTTTITTTISVPTVDTTTLTNTATTMSTSTTTTTPCSSTTTPAASVAPVKSTSSNQAKTTSSNSSSSSSSTNDNNNNSSDVATTIESSSNNNSSSSSGGGGGGSGSSSSNSSSSSSGHSIKSASVQSTSRTSTKAEPEPVVDDLQCQICGKVFSCSSFLMKHIVCMHNGAMKRKANQNRKAANNQKESTSQSIKQEPGTESQANPSKENITAKPSKQTSKKKCKFKYICTVCKRKFRSYVQMCKHRRSAHSKVNVSDKNSAFYDIEQTDFENELLPGDFEAPFLEPKDVAENVARNLCCYIDGRVDSFSDFSKYVKVKGYTSLLEHDPEYLKQESDAIWSEYNFPSSFKTENEICICTKSEESPSLKHLNSQECSPKTSVENPNESTCESTCQLGSHSSNNPEADSNLTDNSSPCDQQTLTLATPTTSLPVTNVVKNHFLSHCGLDLVNNAPSLHPVNEGTANTENICDNPIYPPLSSASVPCLDSSCKSEVCPGFLATCDASQNPVPVITTSVPTLSPPTFSCSSAIPEPSLSKEDTEKQTVSSGDLSNDGSNNSHAGVQETQEFVLDSVPKQVHFPSASVVHKYPTCPNTLCHTASSNQDVTNPDSLKTCGANSNEVYATVLPEDEGPCLQSTSKNDDKKPNGLQQQSCLHNCSQSSTLLKNSEVGKVSVVTPAFDSEATKVNRVLKCGQKDVLFSGPHMMTAHIHERGHLVLEFGNENEISKVKSSSNVRHEEPQKAFSLKSSSSVKKSKKNQNLLDFSIQHIVKSRVEDYKKFMLENHMWPIEVSSAGQVENGENKDSNFINYPKYDIPTRLEKVIDKNYSDSEKISTFIKSGLLPCENLKDLENCFRGVCFQSWNCEVLNYEKIAFGKQGIVNLICSVCHKHFLDLDSLLRHQLHRHPSIECNFLEVELGQSIVALHYPTPNIKGVLCSPNIDLSASKTLETYKCSKCRNLFPTVSRLHSHIIRCASNLDTMLSTTSSKMGKRKYKKRLKKRLRDVLNGSNTFKFRLKDFAGYDPTMFRENNTTRRRLADCENSKVTYIDDDPDKNRKRRGPDLSYDPKNHVRRRESVEVIETHQCRGCNIKFKSLPSLERHAPNCSHKDKLQSLKVLEGTAPAPPVKSKPQHKCHYCSKLFTYPKSLCNHYVNLCSARNQRQKKGNLSMEDLQKEAAIARLVQQEEKEKVSEVQIPAENKPNETEQNPDCKGVKRKLYKKNYSWTSIKKKKNENSEKASSDVENDEDDDEEEEEDDEEEEEEEEELEEGEYALEYDNDDASEEKADWLAFKGEVKEETKSSLHNDDEVPEGNVCRTKSKSSDACLEELLVEKEPLLHSKTVEESSQSALSKQLRNSNVVEKPCNVTNSEIKLSTNSVACKTETSYEHQGAYKNILESELYKQLTKQTMFGSAADSSNADVKQEPRDVELTKASVTDAQPSVFEDQLNEETSKSETQLDGGIDSQASTDNVATERSEVVEEIQTGAICDQEEVKPNSLVAQLPDETAKKTSEDDGQDVKLPENDAGDTDNQHHSLPEESPEDAEKEFGDESNRAIQCHVSDSLPKDTTDGVPQTASEYPLADDAGASNASYVLMPSEFLSGQPTDGNNGETLSLSGGTDVAAAETNTSIVNVEAEGAKEAADVPLLQLCTDGSTMVLWPVGMEGLPSRFKPVDNTLGVTIPGLQVNLTNSSDLVSSTPVCEKTDPENSVSSGIEPLPKEVESPATANESNLSLVIDDEAKMQDSCTEGPSETIKYLLTHPAGQDAEGCQSPSVDKLVTSDSDLSKIEIAREPAEKHIMHSILNKPPLAAPTAAWDMLRNPTLAGPVVNTSLIPVPSDNSEGSMSASCECDPVLNQSSSTNVEVSCGSENISLKTSQPISDTTDDTSANDQLKESSSYCDSETPLLKATGNSISKELDSTTPKEMQCTGCDMKHDTAISCPSAAPCSVSNTFISTAEDSHNNVLNDQEPVSVTSESLENVSQPDSETETDGPTCEVTSLLADATGSETETLAADDCNLNTSPNNISTEECIVEKSSIFEEITDSDKTMMIEESLSGTEVSVLNEPIVAISKNQVQEDGPHVTYTDNVTEEPVAQETVSEHSQVDVCNLNVVYTPLPEFCEVNVTLVPAVSYDIGENEHSIVSVVEDAPMNETVTTSVSVMGDESKSEMLEAVSVPVVGNESEIGTLEVVDGQSENGVVDSVDGEVDQALETSSTVDSEPESETLDTASLVNSNFENETEHAAEVRDSISDDEIVETTSAGDDEPENEAVVTASIIDLKAECETEEVPVEVGCPVNEIVSPVDAEIENVPINETVEIVSVGDNLYEGETVETTSATGSEFEHETTAQAVLVDLSENETPVEAKSAANIICDSGMVTNVSTAMHDIAIEGQVTVPGLSILSDTLENEVAVVEVAVGHEGEEEESSVSAPVKSPEPVVETKLVTPGMNSTWENAVQTTESVSKSSISATGNLPESETGVNVSATNNTLRNEMSALECETDEASEKETVPGLISASADGIAFEDDKSQSGTPVVSLRDGVTNKVSPGYIVMEENSSQASCSVYDSNFVPVVTETDTSSNIVVTLSDVSCGGPSQMEMATLPETRVTLPNPDQSVSLLDSAAAPQIKTVMTETTSSVSGHGENVSVRDTHLRQEETAAFVMTNEAASASLIPVCSAPDDKTSVLHVVSSGDIHGVGEFSPAETVICDIPGKESTSVSVIYSASLEKNSAPVVFSSCSGKVTPAISSVYSTVLLNDDAATSLPVTCGKVIPTVPVVCNIVSEKEAAVVPVVYNSLCGMEPANISVIDSNMSGEQMSAVAGGCSNAPVKVRATSASGMYGSVPGEKTVLGSTAILSSDSHVAETISSLPVACSALPANLLLAPQPSVTSGIVSGTATVTTLTCSGALPKKTGLLLQTCSTIASDKSASLTCNRVVQSTAPFISSTVSSGVLGTVHIPLTYNDVETSTCSSSMVSEVMDSSSLTCGTIESEKRPTAETLRNDRMTSACLTCCSQGPEEAAHIPLTCSDVVLEDTMLASQTCGNAVPVETAATLLACSNVVSKEVAPAPQTCSSVIPERTVPTLLTGSNIVQEETAPAQLTCSSAVPEDTATLLAYSDVVSETVSTPQTCGTVVLEETVPITLTCSKATPEETKPLHLTCGNVPGLDILALSVTNNFVPETENPAPLVEDGISSGADAESESLVSPKVSIPIGNPHTEGLMSVLSKCYNSAANTNKSNQHLDEVTARSENTGFFNPGACNKSLTKCTPSSENNFRLKNTSKNSSFDYLTHSTDTDGGSAKCWKYEASVPQNIQKNPRNEAGKQQLGDLISSSAKHLGETESVKSLGEDVRILMEEQEQDSDSDPLVVLSRVAVAKISESAMKSEENSKKESDYTGVTTLNFESELELEVVPEAIMEGDILYDDFPGSVPFHTVITPDANATLETPPDCRKMMQYLSDTSRTLKHSLPPLSPPVPLLNLPHRYKSETPAAHCLSFDNFEDSTQAKHIKVTDSVSKPGPSLNPSPN